MTKKKARKLQKNEVRITISLMSEITGKKLRTPKEGIVRKDQYLEVTAETLEETAVTWYGGGTQWDAKCNLSNFVIRNCPPYSVFIRWDHMELVGWQKGDVTLYITAPTLNKETNEIYMSPHLVWCGPYTSTFVCILLDGENDISADYFSDLGGSAVYAERIRTAKRKE